MSIRRAFQKVLFPSLIVASFLLSACASSATTPTAMPTRTPPPPDTQTPTLTPAPSPIPTRILTPTITLIPPYPTKQIVLDYDVSGDHTMFDMSYTDHAWSKLVLYTDGQLIIPGRKPRQKVLSKDEVDQLLLDLKNLGFFRLESNQQQDQTDKLYNMGNQYRRIYDAHLYCVLVNAEKSRSLCAYEPFLKFLVPEMKNILYYLDHFEPPGMTAYSPDRILLWVERGRDPYLTDLPDNSIPWNSKFPPLTTSDQKIIYLQGEPAREVYALFGNQISARVLNQDGIDYTAVIDIVLPHEEITNRYEQ